MEDNDNDKSKHFVAQVNAAQQGLYAYILSLVPNPHDARDVLAETNMALWQKRDDGDVATKRRCFLWRFSPCDLCLRWKDRL